MPEQNIELLTNIYSAFDPFRPLPAGDPIYITILDLDEAVQ